MCLKEWPRNLNELIVQQVESQLTRTLKSGGLHGNLRCFYCTEKFNVLLVKFSETEKEVRPVSGLKYGSIAV